MSAKTEAETRSLIADRWLSHPEDGEEVVVTGIAGKFPESDNIKIFEENLFNKVDMVTTKNKRWDLVHPEIPERSGRIPKIEKFDAGYFGITQREADIMDPLCRLLLEKAVEAIYDAGIHPSELEGSKTGVFIACANTDSQRVLFKHDLGAKNQAFLGLARFMIPNRIAYHLKLQGPSYILDTACSSSLFALTDAYKQIRSGKIDSAIIGAATITLHPYSTLEFFRLGVLSPDGASKTFDDSANGYVRAETAAAIFLQKAKDSRRIYAKIVHSQINDDGYKNQGITHPSQEVQRLLLEEFYQGCEVDPLTIEFVEAHGTGTSVGDAEEIIPIDQVFCKERKEPLPVGSVKSNMGHSENPAGLCQLAKIIITMESGKIPPNLHYNKPRKGVEALEEGRIKIVTETTPFKGQTGRIAFNSFGFGGANGHCLVEWNKYYKGRKREPQDDLPRLVCVNGRTKEAVCNILDYVKGNALDVDLIALFHKVFRFGHPSCNHRGFSIVSSKGELFRSFTYPQLKGNPNLITIFGDSSQELKNLGKDLLQLPIFRQIIQDISDAFKINDLFENGNGVLLTTAIQIAILELLEALGVKLHGSRGIKHGEFSSAYANGKITKEDAIRQAHYVDKLLAGVPYTNGDQTNGFVEKETKNYTNSIKSFTDLIEDTAPHKLKNSKIENCEEKLDFNCLVKGMLKSKESYGFLEDLSQDSVILEIGSCKDVDINKLTNGNDIKVIQLPREEDENGILGFLKVMGSLYELGFSVDMEKLYPPVKFPISRGTPMISPLLKWEHSRDWYVMSHNDLQQTCSYDRLVGINVKENDWGFVKGHVIDGRNLFPATGYLFIVWETLAMMKGKMFTDMKIVFENVRFLRATTITDDKRISFTVSVMPHTGDFTVLDRDAVIVTGTIRSCENVIKEQFNSPSLVWKYDQPVHLKEEDVYKELRLRGYNYSGAFKGIKEFESSTCTAHVPWLNNWVAFMDVMLQVQIIHVNSRNLYVPTQIQNMTIDGTRHLNYVIKHKDDVVVTYDDESNTIKSGFIEIRGLNASAIPRRKAFAEPVLEKYVFVPNETSLSTEESIRVNCQIILENNYKIQVKVLEILEDDQETDALAPLICEALGDMPLIQPDVTLVSKHSIDLPNIKVESKIPSNVEKALLFVGKDLLQDQEVLQQAVSNIVPNGFILSRESVFTQIQTTPAVDVITVHETSNEKLVLMRISKSVVEPALIDLSFASQRFDWLPELQEALSKAEDVIIYSINDPTNGILGFVNCLRKEPNGDKVRCYYIPNDTLPFDPSSEFLKPQFKKDLVINVYKDGRWGTYRHMKLSDTRSITEHAHVSVATKGDLSSFTWIDSPVGRQIPVDCELVYVYYSAINFRDIMTATGRLQVNLLDQGISEGFEYSGRTSKGERVMGFCDGRALATTLVADKHFMIPIPDEWSLEDAATVPVVYATVLYTLLERVKIRRGQSILIHAGSGGVGQAAINIALHYGLEVFTTVGTKEKVEFIKKYFPGVKDTNIMKSRDTSFEQAILRRTRGRGVDLILNSLAEDKQIASLRCLAKGGKFLEIGKFDLINDNPLQLELIKKNASFHGIFLDGLFFAEAIHKKRIVDMLLDGIRNGSVKPLKRLCFKETEIEQAFRYMAAGKHIGKILVKMREEETNPSSKPSKKVAKALPRFYCDPDGCYVITGGLGGFGLELADWLVQRGALKLVLTSRVGVRTGYQASRLRKWKNDGCEVVVSTEDIATEDGCERLLKNASQMGTVTGIFNLAVVLCDSILENQTEESFKNSLAPKAVAAKLLDKLSRKICPKLKNFVVFSSVSCGRGTGGQTNYGMANSIMERICERRKRNGYPALAIQWGAVGDVGLVAEMQKEDVELEIGGTLQQRITSCIQVMDRFMKQDEVVVSSMVVAEKRSVSGTADNVVDAVAHIIGVRDLKTVSLHAPLPELGMDSMMATEIKQTLEREFEVFLTPQDVRSLTFARLHEIMSEKVSDQINATENSKDDENSKSKGFETLIRGVGAEVEEGKSLIRLDSLSSNEDCQAVLLLSGLEGSAKTMQVTASQLHSRTFWLQYSHDDRVNSIEEEAKLCLEDVKQLFPSKRFSFIAHSYGCLVVLEMAALLEKEGYLGDIILIDGAPDITARYIEATLGTENGTEFEVKILEAMMSFVLPGDKMVKIVNDLRQCSTREERVDTVLKFQPSYSPYSSQHLKQVILDVQRRIVAVRTYKPTFTGIRSRIILFRPTVKIAADENNDYGLSKLTQQPVEVLFFEGDHFTILSNESVGKVADQLLK